MKSTLRLGAAVFCMLAVLFCVSCAKKETSNDEAQTVQFPADSYSITLPIYAVVEETTATSSTATIRYWKKRRPARRKAPGPMNTTKTGACSSKPSKTNRAT